MSTDAEQIADSILQSAGSGLRHYVPHNRERIIRVTENVISLLKIKLRKELQSEIKLSKDAFK